MNTQTEKIVHLDASGLYCPLPLLKAKKQLLKMESGQTLKVITTDDSSLNDFPSFCKVTGHQIIAIESADKHHTITIQCK